MKLFSFIIFYVVASLVSLLPFRILYWLSDGLYLLVFHVIGYRKRVVYENLRNAFPDKSSSEIDKIARKYYHHLCDIMVEIIKMMHISKSSIVKHVKFSNPQVFDDDYADGKHILMVISHFNNWEWLGTLSLQTSYKINSIYKPLRNKFFDRFMIRVRRRFGADVVPMAKTGRFIVEKFKGNQPCMLNFLSDQSPGRSEVQYWTTFLNQDTPVYLGVEKLAIKTRQPVYFGKPVKIKRGYYSVEIKKICDDASLLQEHQLTELHIRELEKAILDAPECWLWSHRRWKIKREAQL